MKNLNKCGGGLSVFLTAIMTLQTGCGLFQRQPALPPPVSPEDLQKRPELVSPPATPRGANSGVMARRGAGVGVVLGPGGLKAYAHIGVLRELEKAQISVDAIVGLEWGSLVGAAYAIQGRSHDAEWKLLKLKKEDFSQGAIENLFSKEPGDISVLGPFLRATLENRQIQDLKNRFSCPSINVKQDKVIWRTQGPLQTSVESCLAYPPFFSPAAGAQAAPFDLEEAASHLRAVGIETIVFINVLAHGVGPRSDLLWRELKRSLSARRSLFDVVVDVPTKGYDLGDMNSLRQLILIGQKSGAQAVRQIEAKLSERK